MLNYSPSQKRETEGPPRRFEQRLYESHVKINARISRSGLFFLPPLTLVDSPSPPSAGSLQGSTPMAHPEDELERLTKKMLFDMDNPPSEEYFGERSTSSHTRLVNRRCVCRRHERNANHE